MTKEQREAVARLRRYPIMYHAGLHFVDDEATQALRIVLDILTPSDPTHRIVALDVEPPRRSDECGGCGLFLSCEWQCREWRNEWSYRGDQMVEVAIEVPGDGCPFKEEA